jgi:SAM-dependent methyltransferase
MYESAAAVNRYLRVADDGLTAVEERVFAMVDDSYRNSVLDIGIGGGRTIPPLTSMFRKYVGIDYSGPLISAAKSHFPSAELHVMDARDITIAERFDCALFSYNGIDAVDLEDRYRIIASVRDHLRPGGLFIFSTHNLKYERVQVWLHRLLVREMFGFRSHSRHRWLSRSSARRVLRSLRRALRCLPGRLARFRQQRTGPGYAIVNDPGNGFFDLMHVYVDVEKEKEKLRDLGLTTVATIGNLSLERGYSSTDAYVYLIMRTVSDLATSLT